MIILGISAYHADVSAALIKDGALVCAIEEERFRRIKHVAGYPAQAMRACLEMAGIKAAEVDHFAVSHNPRAHLWRKVLFTLRKRPHGALLRTRLKNAVSQLGLAARIAETLGLETAQLRRRVHWVEHHPAHLSSAFFVSPFQEAAVCSIDGFGDFVSTSVAIGRGPRLDIIERVFYPHSLGLLYLAITQYLGFMKYGDEYKVMGLAPYGKPSYCDQLRRLLRLKPNGRFELNLDYFSFWSGSTPLTWEDGEPALGPVYSAKLEELLGPARKYNDPLEPRHEDLAASLQVVYEEAAFRLLNEVHRRTRMPNLCLAGGCAMNSVANGKVRENTPFQQVYIQPAAADNGTSLGAAFYVWNNILGQARSFQMQHALWGPEFDDAAIVAALARRQADLQAQRCEHRVIADENALCCWTAQRVSEGAVVGWFQGKMEWGARALGNRSIVADPRRADMREIINTKIKFREKFRPFAPSIAEEALNDFFVGGCLDPFMIQVYPVRPEKRQVIPAVTHVDGSGRLQTVSAGTNPRYYKLIKSFESITGVPVLLNTSFNENEPIVHTPDQALDCFLRTRMDHIVLGNHTVSKGA